MDEAAVVMAGLGAERILQAIELVTSQQARQERALRVVADYRPVNVSRKVVRIILSYVDYVDSTVWRKPV